jgi:citronellol/citronellal dehydrogenase
MFQSNLFSDKTVLVTGGGSGIGFEIAKQFLQLGAEVYIGSRKQERIEEAVIKLHHYGKCKAFRLDIREPESVQHLADMIEAQSGKLDVLINNAGGQFPSPAEAISPKGFGAVVNNNLNGTWNVIHEMANRFFLKQKSGNIVNIVVNNYRGFAGMSHTGAARAGVQNLSMSLAVEWANRGININCIAPGIIQSSGLENYPPEMVAGVAKNIPMKRLGSMEEVAWLAVFLASPMAAYITGENIYIDGGSRLWGDIWQVE